MNIIFYFFEFINFHNLTIILNLLISSRYDNFNVENDLEYFDFLNTKF